MCVCVRERKEEGYRDQVLSCSHWCVCMRERDRERERERERERPSPLLFLLMCVCGRVRNRDRERENRGRVQYSLAKTHRIPYLFRSFSAKATYI